MGALDDGPGPGTEDLTERFGSKCLWWIIMAFLMMVPMKYKPWGRTTPSELDRS